MALTAQSIIERVQMIIQDWDVRWPVTELTNWLNDARREIAVVRPDIYSDIKTDFTCVAGAKQTLPELGLRLMDIPRNASGPAVTVTQRGFLDQQNPGWQQLPGQGTIKHFMVDERKPNIFWVYPPATTSAVLEVIYQKAPTDYTTASTLTAYEELYGGAMVDYMAYRAFSKDSEYAGNAQRALAHYQQFATALGLGRQTDFASSANQNNIGGARNNPRGGGVGAAPAVGNG